jgi:dipeptidyl aminopeptidase/acylaminoacyl peptidase
VPQLRLLGACFRSVARWTLASLVVAATVVLAAPAHATFPGRNGSILLVEQFQRSGVYGEGELVAIDPRTGRRRTLWRCGGPAQAIPECDAVTTPAVSPRGDSAAVLSVRGLGAGRRWTLTYVELASASARSVELATDEYFPTDDRGRVLRWIGDGSSLSVMQYTEQATGPESHRRLFFDGTLGPPIGPPGATSFDWSIDGRAAFEAGSNLFVLSPDGSRRRLTRKGGADPSWSPRGRWIAFTRAGQIWVVRSEGGRPRQLTKKGGERPVWSPDGRQIAFLRRRRGRGSEAGMYLWVLDRRGGPARRLGHDPIESWSYGPSAALASPPEWQALPR